MCTGAEPGVIAGWLAAGAATYSTYAAGENAKNAANDQRKAAERAKAETMAAQDKATQDAYMKNAFAKRALRENSLFTGGGPSSSIGGRQTLGV